MNGVYYRAQGTIEYLVIIAVVVVLSLVVVGLVSGVFGSSGSNVSSSSNKISGLASNIGITESLVDPTDGNFVLRLLNNSGDNLTVSNVRVGDNNVAFSEDLAQGNSKFFRVHLGAACVEGKVVSEDVVVTYVTRDGLTKTEIYPSKIMFDCSPYVIAQANLADQCPSCGSTCSGGSQSLSASSVSVAAGCYTATDLNIVDSDLVGSNILDTATIFGITGTASAGGGGAELHSGQATVYDSDGDDATNDGTAKDYTDNGDGTVTDNQTGLMWEKDDYSNGTPVLWDAAIDTCEAATTGSYSDWRVPSNVELITLADYSYSGSSYLNSVFTQTGWNSTCYGYWSSTTVSSNPPFIPGAYALVSDSGIIENINKSNVNYGVRCVRSGS